MFMLLFQRFNAIYYYINLSGFHKNLSLRHSPDGLHHAGISQLPGAEFAIKGQGLLKLIGLDAPDKEGLAQAQGLHEGLQRLAELDTQSRGFLTSLGCLEQYEQMQSSALKRKLTEVGTMSKHVRINSLYPLLPGCLKTSFPQPTVCSPLP